VRKRTAWIATRRDDPLGERPINVFKTGGPTVLKLDLFRDRRGRERKGDSKFGEEKGHESDQTWTEIRVAGSVTHSLTLLKGLQKQRRKGGGGGGGGGGGENRNSDRKNQRERVLASNRSLIDERKV